MPRVTSAIRARTRERLLRTAAEHFARDGFDGAGIDRISLAAGFAKGTVYNYFPSKDALFAGVIEEASRHAAAIYARGRPGGTVRERLLALARADVQVLREQEPFTRVLVREAMSFRAPTYPLVVRHLAPFLEVAEQTLADGARNGEVRQDAAAGELALLFAGLLSLHYVQHWGSGGAWPALDDIPELVVRAFLEGAAHRPPSPRPVARRRPSKDGAGGGKGRRR